MARRRLGRAPAPVASHGKKRKGWKETEKTGNALKGDVESRAKWGSKNEEAEDSDDEQVNSEDDEEIDSDEAFDESDEERFSAFKFLGSKSETVKSRLFVI